MKTKLFLVSLFLTILTYAQIPTNNLVAQYNFDTGATLVDGINGANLTQIGSALTTVTDRFGNANAAVSLNGDHLTRPDINISDLVSYSFWIKTTTVDNKQKTIIDNSDRISTTGGYISNQGGHHIALVNGEVMVEAKLRQGNGYPPLYLTSRADVFIADGNWHHVAVRILSYNTPSVEGRVNIFIDGAKSTENTVGYDVRINNSVGSIGNVSIGTNRNNTLTNDHVYTGAIDDINIYDRGISAQEVQDLLVDNDFCVIPYTSVITFSNVTGNEAMLQFSTGTATTYDVAYHKASEPFANAIITTNITTGNLPITNLTSATLYKVYIRKHCAVNNISAWSLAKNLRTNGDPIYVNQAAIGSNDGSSWADAFTDLQTAINTVNDNSEIWVAKGVYKPDTSNKEASYIINKENIKIYGGFVGTESNIGDRVRGANETILSGDLNHNDVNTSGYSSNYSNTTRLENSRHIITIANGGENLLLDGLTISDAHNNGSATIQGGAVVKDKTIAKLTLKNCTIKDNVSRNGNAGLLAEFDLNNANGAVGELHIENIEFVNNMSSFGSGIYSLLRDNTHVNITVANSLFEGNIAADRNTGSSGIIGLAGSSAWIRNIGNANSELTIKFINNTVVNNKDLGTNNGLNNQTRATLALSKGSGTAGTTTATVENCIFWGNTVVGGTIGRSITDLHKTPLNNLTVKNSIDEANFSDSSITSVVASSNADPLFTDFANDDYTLTGASPAVDTGDNTNVVGTVDLLGKQRVFNTTVDIGCYEYGAPTLSINDHIVEKPIVVYPNPVSEVLYVKAKSIATIRVYSILGKEVITTKQAEIPVSNLKPGIYIITIQTKSGKQQTNRFIKK